MALPRRNTQRSATASSATSRGPPEKMRRVFTFEPRQSSPDLEEPQLIQATFPVYHLKWEKLKAFLERKFPGHSFSETRTVSRLTK